ncbi:hypothetical protein M6B38_323675 [Iris pallida]|uniref:Uncharacterized protein n=1 Tax=Iris pallida TaxID=29817 RepID=A0AAX6H9Y1_IRIPA|nr:hypothetical protein M6B38_323675 [Iris pallida]
MLGVGCVPCSKPARAACRHLQELDLVLKILIFYYVYSC